MNDGRLRSYLVGADAVCFQKKVVDKAFELTSRLIRKWRPRARSIPIDLSTTSATDL